VAAGEREAAFADREEELVAAARRLADAEDWLARTVSRLEQAESARADLEQEVAVLRDHQRAAGTSGQSARLTIESERLAATRRRLTALDERLTGAIGMVPTIVIPDRPGAPARGRGEAAATRKPRRGNGRPGRPGEVPPAPRSRD
jgi:hypothetical protein